MYQYTESGLRNVWLRNGYTITDTSYGSVVNVQNLNGLIRAIANALVQKTDALTSPEIRYLRHFIDISQKDFATFVGVQEQTVSLWERSKQRIPKSADVVLRALVLELLSGRLKFRELLDSISLKNQSIEVDKFTFESINQKDWLIAA